MPLPVAHGLVGASVAAALAPEGWMATRRRRVGVLLAGALLANAPDFDFLLAFALRSRAWHRGFTHSLAFALLSLGLLALWLGRARLREALACGLAYASHGLLDWATTKEGGGVELLWPLTGERFGLRWHGLSELPSRLAPLEVVQALAVESALFGPPLAAVLLLHRLRAKRGGAGAG